ncbi:hypothetical protein GCM10009527_098050 [Actinomadura nitritigenes]|uniref:HTH cro/C1-type domain-containing protein n=1 Tax=Actinomadura nitritigenes TaxID=134602 RepID=A0ABS3QWE3_9ACTN|nr:hypothetical protein [Actinomadura nitritigenes]MBO2438289.1 hypothetical protein [Actinomadura nitritigenes]
MTTQTGIFDDRFVAFRVRYELERQKRKQTWLAAELGQPRDWLNRRLSGPQPVPFTVTEIARIAEILGVDVTVFFPPAPRERAS